MLKAGKIHFIQHELVHLNTPFFWAGRKNRQITLSAYGGAENSVRLLLTKNTARFFSCPSCQIPAALAVCPVSGPFILC